MKRVKSRLTVLLAIFAVLAMCLGIAFMPKADKAIAEVNTSTGFYVEDGAAARLVEGQSGIKWTVHITKAKYNSIQEKFPITVQAEFFYAILVLCSFRKCFSIL